VETVKKLVTSYFNVVRKQMIDYVPKTIMAFLVKGILTDLQGELVSRLYSDATVNEMTVSLNISINIVFLFIYFLLLFREWEYAHIHTVHN
jgi:hypothetical protein